MKKTIIAFLIIVFSVLVILFLKLKSNNKEVSNKSEIINTYTAQNTEISDNTIKENKVDEEMDIVYIKVNNTILNVELEDNSATKELIERLKNKDVIVNAHEYGGFEKVGDLGFLLPRDDKNITTSAGDIVLYQGNQISLFYNSNSWSYTKLGKIKNIDNDELKNILGNGDVTLTFTLSK